jgi:hypothetical protein
MPSSVIRGFSYDLQKRELHVTFVSGRRYSYVEVPAEVFDAFKQAPSRGAFFNHAIRDRYRYREDRRRSGAQRE